ncbi:MAG: hypothetical protein RLZZ58_1912 [Pseudomonadota bacterium]
MTGGDPLALAGWARAAAEPHHDRGWIKRFDPRFWTVGFARPMMAAVVTTAPDALRIDAQFYGRGDLGGLIWESVDRWDHPLLAYETARDYRGCTFTFRWTSGGVVALDAVHGPTLTIEGRDAGGAPRIWNVRLWNYAAGSPTDALITLDFGALDGGFLLPGQADPVFAGDIDRMLISCVPPGYDGSALALTAPAEGWVELHDMRCGGAGSTLAIGDAVQGENSLSIANGYDDCYHMTPARVVRQIVQLGYRGDVVHYVGMSHYFRLEWQSGDLRASLTGGAINAPCAAWHAGFAAEAMAAGLGVIWSLSYELFAAHCPPSWRQIDAVGAPALTAWDPPSALLSPANSAAMGYLQLVARAFVGIGKAAGLAAKFQVGEPWWWVNAGGKLCAYDTATTAALGAVSVPIADVRGAQSPAARAMLDALGVLLAQSTAALVAAARDQAGPAPLTSHVLVFLPTVLDAAAPELRRANVPVGWAGGAFDILQLEDYDWVTGGRGEDTAEARTVMAARLGYPVSAQHYFAGFVLDAADRDQWRAIAAAARNAQADGVARVILWALPQVARDGFVAFAAPSGEDEMAFDDVHFPIAIGREASVITEFSTDVISADSGYEQRSTLWQDARMQYDAGPGVRSEADVRALIDFYRARRGAARGFRFRDPIDQSSAADGGVPAATDQRIGTGDGTARNFALVKVYGAGEAGATVPQQRAIRLPDPAAISVAVGGAVTTSWALLPGGVIRFDVPPAPGAAVTAGFLFDVPVRFARDQLDISRATFLAGEIASVPLIEVRGQ